jgi:hypothetical protein
MSAASEQSERLRQERETFDQMKVQSERWFSLRLAMAYATIVILFAIATVAAWITLHPVIYSPATVSIAAAALFADTLGLAIAIFRLVLRPQTTSPLRPVTPARRR